MDSVKIAVDADVVCSLEQRFRCFRFGFERVKEYVKIRSR